MGAGDKSYRRHADIALSFGSGGNVVSLDFFVVKS